MSDAGRVRALHRYPVKSAGGEALRTARVGTDGLVGDRIWALVDDDGVVVSAKHPRPWGRLLDVTARVQALSDEVTVAVPDVAVTPAGSPEANGALSRWLGRHVTLTRSPPPDPVLHRWWPEEPGLIPEWVTGAVPGTATRTPLPPHPEGRFFDGGTVHLVTTAALATLARRHGRPVDHGRFRPNIVAELPADPAPGQRMRIGTDVVIEVTLPTPRCAVPALDHGGGADDGLLRTLARYHRTEIAPFGRATCFGVYAAVVTPGRVRVDDDIAVL
ncbi:MOSC N-terminal beta barrel domain-containing protein [Micromonospora sp. NPDC049679]|uniref:MOSC domain-containing protein n=1 Tax=Micromonospora sp. NPDC049679 TaxID=3155920 RepID=UPI0033F0AB12